MCVCGCIKQKSLVRTARWSTVQFGQCWPVWNCPCRSQCSYCRWCRRSPPPPSMRLRFPTEVVLRFGRLVVRRDRGYPVLSLTLNRGWACHRCCSPGRDCEPSGRVPCGGGGRGRELSHACRADEGRWWWWSCCSDWRQTLGLAQWRRWTTPVDWGCCHGSSRNKLLRPVTAISLRRLVGEGPGEGPEAGQCRYGRHSPRGSRSESAERQIERERQADRQNTGRVARWACR